MAIMNFGGVDENVSHPGRISIGKGKGNPQRRNHRRYRIRRTRSRTKYELAGQRIQCHRRAKKRLEDMG